MKLMPSRRLYRRVFRRVRIYLPLIALVLLAMVLFLPLSAPWMARRFESELLKRAGLKVALNRLEVEVARGRIQAFGLTVPGSGDEEPFTLDFVTVEGSVSGLLAGGERFPDTIRISSPPALRIVRDSQGRYELQGGVRTLIRALEPVLKGKAAPSTPQPGSAPAPRRGVGRTPEVELENVRLLIEPPDSTLPPLELTLARVRLAPRATEASPFEISAYGIATAASSERFTIYVTAFPDSDRLEVGGRLEGISVPFQIPGLGGFEGVARRVGLDATIRQEVGDVITGTVALTAERFELGRARVGGERWQDRDVTAQLRFAFDRDAGRLDVGELSLLGGEIDVAVSGGVELHPGLPGEVRAVVNRLPGGVLALGRNELLDRLSVSIEPATTTTTLRMEAFARGEFARPASLESEAFATLAGWRIRIPQLPQPLVVNDLTLLASNDSATLRRLDVDYDELSLLVSGNVPLRGSGDGSLQLSLGGRSESVIDLLGELGGLPPEVNAVRLPFRVRGAVPFRLDPSGGVALTTASLTLGAEWGAGELLHARFPDPIRIEPGSVKLERGVAALQRLRVGSRSIVASANGSLQNFWPVVGGAAPQFEGALVSSGRVEDVEFLAARVARLPRLPSDLKGAYQLDARVDCLDGRLEAPSYSARLQLEDGSATIPTLHRMVPLRGVTLDLTASNELVELRRGSLRIEDPVIGTSRVEFGLRVDEQEMRADATVRSRFEYLTALLARDLSDLVMEGTLPATAWATARPGAPLAPGPDVARRWIAHLTKPGLKVGISEGADLILDYEARYTQETPVTIFARELPVMISNIRGGATFRPKEGIVFNALEADIGSAKDARVSGSVVIGKPTTIRFNVELDYLDVNEWLDGWGERPWASKPISYVPRWKANPNPVQFIQLEGNIRTRGLKFMQFEGGAAAAKMELQAWSRRPVLMWLREFELEAYGGRGSTPVMTFEFPQGQRAKLDLTARLEEIELKGFMDALYERPQAMDGALTGDMSFSGQLLNYPTYTGKGTYTIERTGVVGNVFLTYWRDLLQPNSTTGGRDGTIRGAVDMAEQKVNFRDMRIFSPVVNITADGHVDFRGRLSFDVTASVISKRLKTIPVISVVGDLWDMIGRQIISYRLEGTLKAPKYFPVPTVIGRLQSMRDFVRQTTTSAPTENRQP